MIYCTNYIQRFKRLFIRNLDFHLKPAVLRDAHINLPTKRLSKSISTYIGKQFYVVLQRGLSTHYYVDTDVLMLCIYFPNVILFKVSHIRQ